jgi:hypothetical protein
MSITAKQLKTKQKMEKKKIYVIESKGFTQGIGSSIYKQKRNALKEQIKKELEKLEKKLN